jgi:sugar phosphate isomerase/epimerase
MARMSRREFGAITIGAAPLAGAALHDGLFAAAGPLTIGITTTSFRDLPRVTGKDNLDDVLKAVEKIGVPEIDLSLSNIEPAPPSVAPFLAGSAAYPVRVVLTPEQIARTNQQARIALREWRLTSAVGAAAGVRAKLARARVNLRAVSAAFDESFTAEEFDATFTQIAALGAHTVASSLTKATALRVKPYAERYAIVVAIHNQSDGAGTGPFGTSDLAEALAISPAFKLKLDVGNITASNADAVAEIGKHRARVAYVVVRDRLRNGGASQPFGEGDTPITKVFTALKAFGGQIPAMVEYDYVGLRPAMDEIALSMKYVAEAAR